MLNSELNELTESQLISIISSKSSRYGDKLIEFMGTYKISGLRYAQKKQLIEFIINKKLSSAEDTHNK